MVTVQVPCRKLLLLAGSRASTYPARGWKGSLLRAVFAGNTGGPKTFPEAVRGTFSLQRMIMVTTNAQPKPISRCLDGGNLGLSWVCRLPGTVLVSPDDRPSELDGTSR
jgi:hypothetical protein